MVGIRSNGFSLSDSPKVGKFDHFLAFELNVLRLDVTMEYPVAVHVVQRLVPC